MKIDKNSWHYRLYKSTYLLSSGESPQQSNLCQYVRRLIFGTILIWLLAMPLIAVIGVAVAIVIYLYNLMMGRKPVSWNPLEVLERPEGYRFVYYEPLKVRNRHIYPWHLLPLLIWVVVAYYYTYWTLLATGGALVTIAIWVVVYFTFSSETMKIVGAYLRSKKQGICPSVEFTDGPSDFTFQTDDS